MFSGPIYPESNWAAVLYGQAIGDALGIPLEFKPALHIQLKYPEGFDLQYRKTVRWGMDPAWKAGEFSDDTWQAIEIIRAYCDTLDTNDGVYDEDLYASNFAQGIIRWVGYDGRGCGAHTSKVIGQSDFWLDPHSASKRVWEESNRKSAPNGAIMRASVCGMIRYWDLSWTIAFAAATARVTHYDPRCVASAVAVAVYVACIMQGDSWQDAAETAAAAAEQIDAGSTKYTRATSLDQIELDEGMMDKTERPPIGFTYKGLGAGFVALRIAAEEDPMSALAQVIEAGGDTDTNAAIAGAMLGVTYGLEAFPVELITGLVQRDVLNETLTRLRAWQPETLMGLPSPQMSAAYA